MAPDDAIAAATLDVLVRLARDGRPEGDGSADLPAAPAYPGDAQPAHQPPHRAPSHPDALPVEFTPDLQRAIDLVVALPDPHDLLGQLPIAHRPGRRLSADRGVVGARCDPRPVLTQHPTDRLDTDATLMLVNQPHELRCAGPSSSAAKKADAALRISLPRRSSRTSARSRHNSADSSLLTPGRLPASISAWRTHYADLRVMPTRVGRVGGCAWW